MRVNGNRKIVLRVLGGALLVPVLIAIVVDGIGGHGANDWSRTDAWWDDAHAVHAALRGVVIALLGALIVSVYKQSQRR